MWLCTIIGRVCFCTCKLRQIPRSWDRSIVVHDESSKTEVVHRRATNSHKAKGSTIQVFLGSSEIPGWSEAVLDDKDSSFPLLRSFCGLSSWASEWFPCWRCEHPCTLQGDITCVAYRPCCFMPTCFQHFSAIAVVHVWWHNPPTSWDWGCQTTSTISDLSWTVHNFCVLVVVAGIVASIMLRSRHLGLIATGSTDCVIAVRESCTQRIWKMRAEGVGVAHDMYSKLHSRGIWSFESCHAFWVTKQAPCCVGETSSDCGEQSMLLSDSSTDHSKCS